MLSATICALLSYTRKTNICGLLKFYTKIHVNGGKQTLSSFHSVNETLVTTNNSQIHNKKFAIQYALQNMEYCSHLWIPEVNGYY